MRKQILFKISLIILGFLLLLLIGTKVFVEPWLAKKMEVKVNEKYNDYLIGIGNVNISFLKSGLTIENLTVNSKKEQDGIPELVGEIASIRLSGINLTKFLFKKDLDIKEVIVFESSIIGKIPSDEKPKPPMVSGLNIRINRLFLDRIDFTLGKKLTASTYSVKNGILLASDLHIAKFDTLSPAIFNKVDFEADELMTVSSDSMYTFAAQRFKYSDTTRIMSVDSFAIHPNYTDYAFTSRSNFQTDRIEAGFRNILVHDFSVSAFLKSNSLISSGIEIETMRVRSFRDKRKKFRHVNRPAFQDMIYNYPGSVNIDSLSISNGNVIYTEHAEKATEPGKISFTEINVKIFKISNDTIYKTVKGYIRLEVTALLMGSGHVNIHLQGRLFDSMNTFSLHGGLSEMEVGELNPLLENSSFIKVTSGKINSMNFSFIANNTKATGEMIFLYEGLKIMLINKKTDETTAMNEKLGSYIANMIILDANPLPPGNVLRKGTINYKRDPERFLFNYCAKSILTGSKSTLTVQKN